MYAAKTRTRKAMAPRTGPTIVPRLCDAPFCSSAHAGSCWHSGVAISVGLTEVDCEAIEDVDVREVCRVVRGVGATGSAADT